MTQPYQFAFHDRVPTKAPHNEMFERCKEASTDKTKPLTREEKDRFFHCMQSNSGKGKYMQSGWVYPFQQFMKLYIVQYTYESQWHEIWAFDKTCIRTSFYTNSNLHKIKEMPK